jgi:dihydrofolate reductase
MKTILWATLNASGSYARASADQPPRPEALADFGARAIAAGNFVVGRRTFDAFQAQPARGGDRPFATTDIVVVTSQPVGAPGATAVTSPRAALAHLATRGHTTAFLAGGEHLHNAFLAEDLVDELVLVFAPALADKALTLGLPAGRHRPLTLLAVRELGSSLVSLHYAVQR